MCGIIGYTGRGEGIEKALEGLKNLEYRGYDSAGIAFARNDGLVCIVKTNGRVETLIKKVDKSAVSSTVIGHTRWATHGAPTSVNAHPHRVGAVTVVHNGIIENYRELYNGLKALGYDFLSDTDTEVAAAVINEHLKTEKTPESALRKAISEMKGKYAFALIFQDRPHKIYAVRRGSPLVIGRSDDGYFVSSDINAITRFAHQYFALPEDVVAVLDGGNADIVDTDGKQMDFSWTSVDASTSNTALGTSESYMLKEMHESSLKLLDTVMPRIYDGIPSFAEDGIAESLYCDIEEIKIVACGSAMHAGLVGGRLLETLAGVPTTVHFASEYRYFPPIYKYNTLVILISQSGETADTLAALNYAKSAGHRTLSIVNVADSSIARESDFNIYTYAGPEIAVATTKGYVTQIALLWELSVAFALARGKLNAENSRKIIADLVTDAPSSIKNVLSREDQIDIALDLMRGKQHAFYIGRGVDFSLAMEGALKLKEISYIHAEAYAAGELKHGTIALIEEGTPIVAVATDEKIYLKIENNIRELKARGAKVILIAPGNAKKKITSADVYIEILCKSYAGAVFGATAAMQLLAYNVAKQRKCDIDHPRNLAKSVTVE